jgi:hypothetical protein
MEFSVSRSRSCSIGKLLVELKTHLVLDQELDTLNGGSSSLGDSGGNTTHCKSVSIIDLDDVTRIQRPGWMACQCLSVLTQEVDNEAL